MLTMNGFYKQKHEEKSVIESEEEGPLFPKLVQVRRWIEEEGLRLAAIEGFPGCSTEPVMYGREGSDSELERLKQAVRAVGRAGIPVLGYDWSPKGVGRTSVGKKWRGDAKVTAFETRDLGKSTEERSALSADELWRNYERFLKEILPVAEEVGVKLALHPNDPPISDFDGTPLVHTTIDDFNRTMDLVESPNHGINLGLGTWSASTENVFDVIERFGKRDEIFYVHFRDVQGTVPSFHETFVDQGNYDTFEVLRALKAVEYDGILIPDHVPQVAGDTDWGHRSRSFAVGYLRAALESIADD
ncbi:mannonate dehydratase [Haloarcula nitratireducens]|nr:mannonate dehydratase [Halomicroarcula nitratireducens]